MTLKQRLAELLPHFDGNLQLSAGKALMENAAGCWKLSKQNTFDYVLHETINGVDFRVEDTPKRPRGVYLRFDKFSVPTVVCETNPGGVRFIEDTPLPVSDKVVSDCWRIYRVELDDTWNGMRKALEHYEANRTKALP